MVQSVGWGVQFLAVGPLSLIFLICNMGIAFSLGNYSEG